MSAFFSIRTHVPCIYIYIYICIYVYVLYVCVYYKDNKIRFWQTHMTTKRSDVVTHTRAHTHTDAFIMVRVCIECVCVFLSFLKSIK
jgi:hypothetical protein